MPLISASSRIPPTEKRKNLRCKTLAILRPMLVLPTPGGPTRQMILPLRPLDNLPTLISSKMRCLMSSKP